MIENTTQTLLALLQTFQNIAPDFPMQYAVCLLHISYDEGLSLTELTKKTGIPLSTASRIIGALSDHRQRGQAFGLVTVKISTTERRRLVRRNLKNTHCMLSVETIKTSSFSAVTSMLRIEIGFAFSSN